MNLETRLEPALWDAVRSSVEARNFTSAVLDAIHLLSDVIRDRAVLEGDGVALIGAAFGGNSPRLKVNRLQTESEQNVQRGVESLLRGLYQAIRNPRSHATIQDNERDATAILLLVDYLYRTVEQSRSPFSLPEFVGRVLDPDFVPSERYAALLLREIPAKKRLSVCRELFARRADCEAGKVQFFYKAVLAEMTSDETDELYDVVSQELRQTNDDATIRFVLGAFPAASWPRFDEIARLRIENKLIRAIADGRWIGSQKKCLGGALGTWATNILGYLTLKDELWYVVFAKLESSDATEQDYAFKYFTQHVEACYERPPWALEWRVNQGIRAGDARFRQLAEGWQTDLVEERPLDHPWRKPFVEALASFSAANAEEVADDIPF